MTIVMIIVTILIIIIVMMIMIIIMIIQWCKGPLRARVCQSIASVLIHFCIIFLFATLL
jgi:hypothetical protein